MHKIICEISRIATAITLVAAPANASADTIQNVFIKGVGVQGQQLYAIIDRELTSVCSGRIVYLSFSIGNVNQVLSLFLTAKATGSMVARIDYHLESSCQIGLVQL